MMRGSCFLFLLFTLHLNPILAYFLKNCTVLYSDNFTAGVSVDCNDLDLFGIPEDIPRDVISLNIFGNHIQKIHKKDFYSLSNLTDLNLGVNSITNVDNGAFVSLVQLTVLKMYENKLTRLTDNMFQGLSSLLKLDLEYNYIQIINPAAFQSLTSLQELDLHDNYIQIISPAAFQSLTSLQELYLASNHITDIITILELPSLQVLELNIYEIESFESKDLPLNMSSALRELRVHSRSIKRFSITTAVFPHLKIIDLSRCCNDTGWEWDVPDKYFLRNITTVYLDVSIGSYNATRKALQSLVSLENLWMRFNDEWKDRHLLNIVCKIPTLRTLSVILYNHGSLSKTLSYCTQLTYLDLSDNDLTELPKDLIKQMKQLSHLYLGSNNLYKVPDDVKNLSMLQILYLSYNRINDLSCSDFLNLTRLTHLYLDHNDIHELKLCVFQHLNELKVLTVSHNLITWSGDTFTTGLQKLEFLALEINNIIWPTEHDVMRLKSLKHLHMYCKTMFVSWDNNYFEGLDELETLELYLDYNNDPLKMTSSPPHELQWQNVNTTLLQRLKSFTIHISPAVYIQSPHITHIVWEMLSDMKHLELLDVKCGKQLDPGSFNLPQLKTLSFHGCNLTSLDFLAQANLTQLFWLDLSYSELTVINVSVFSFLPALRYINMNNNPFDCCDLSTVEFQQWVLNNKQTLVVDAHHYTCGFPLAKNGTRFLDFDYNSSCVDTDFNCFISSTCVIVLTLLTSFTYHFLRLHLFYGYYLFIAFLYDAKQRKRGSPERYDAFISYNRHDELWVCREMLPVLEGEQGWRLCLHHRDFLPGKPILENIADAIYGSRKTICVISRHYLESEWCSREIQMASFRLFDEQKDVLILVFLEDIPTHQLSPYYHMRRLVKRHTYLSWSQAGQHPGLFWENLRRALNTNLEMNNL